jgi:hypothetical protein
MRVVSPHLLLASATLSLPLLLPESSSGLLLAVVRDASSSPFLVVRPRRVVRAANVDVVVLRYLPLHLRAAGDDDADVVGDCDERDDVHAMARARRGRMQIPGPRSTTTTTTTTTMRLLEGLVTNRRAIGKHLVFLDVLVAADAVPPGRGGGRRRRDDAVERDAGHGGDDGARHGGDAIVQAVMRRDLWNDDVAITDVIGGDVSSFSYTTSYDVCHGIIQPGVRVRLFGNVGRKRGGDDDEDDDDDDGDDDGARVLFCRAALYSLPNDDPRHMRNVLRYAIDGMLDANALADALHPYVGRDELSSMLLRAGGGGSGGRSSISFPSTSTSTSSSEEEEDGTLEGISREILGRFPKHHLSNPSRLTGSTNARKRDLLSHSPPKYATAPPPPPPRALLPPQNRSDPDEGGTSSVADVLLRHRTTRANDRYPANSDDANGRCLTVSGWVRNRRRYRGYVSVIELVDEFASMASMASTMDGADGDNVVVVDDDDDDDETMGESSSGEGRRLRAVLHPDALARGDGDDTSTRLSEIYGNVLCRGARVVLEGYVTSDPPDDAPVFWATGCRLLRSSWRPSAVRHVLDLLHGGEFDVDEAATALNFAGGYSQARGIAAGRTTATERRWLAAELTQSLQGEHSRAGKVTPSMIESLDEFAYSRNEYPVEAMVLESELDWSPASESRAVRSMDSRWQRVKKPQLKFMIDQIESVLRSHPAYGKRILKVVDIGGGKGLLSNVLAEMFGDDFVEVRVVDLSISATNNGMMKARRRGLKNVRYDAMDATRLEIDGVDVVVALHACGALSDVALGHAARHGAGFVVCPCCFLSNPHLRVPVAPMRDDGGNHHSDLVAVEEWLDVDPARYGSLRQLAEVQGDIQVASEAMHAICGLRSMAVRRLWRDDGESTGVGLQVSIKKFPIGFSTRNFCMVGKFE